MNYVIWPFIPKQVTINSQFFFKKPLVHRIRLIIVLVHTVIIGLYMDLCSLVILLFYLIDKYPLTVQSKNQDSDDY